MSYGTTQSTSVPLQGDNESKRLAALKEQLIGDISRIGAQIEAGEKQLAEYKDLDQKITESILLLETLKEDIEITENEVALLNKNAEDFRRLGGDIEKATLDLGVINAKIDEASITLKQTLEQIRLKDTELVDKKKNFQVVCDELDVLRQQREAEVATLGSDLERLRTDIASLSIIKDSKLSELKGFDERLAKLFLAEENKKIQNADLDIQIEQKKRDIGSLELELQAKRSADTQWLINEKTLLKEKEEELAKREGAISQRSAMLDSRADSLRASKIRLEHHLGKNIDLVIE